MAETIAFTRGVKIPKYTFMTNEGEVVAFNQQLGPTEVEPTMLHYLRQNPKARHIVAFKQAGSSMLPSGLVIQPVE